MRGSDLIASFVLLALLAVGCEKEGPAPPSSPPPSKAAESTTKEPAKPGPSLTVNHALLAAIRTVAKELDAKTCTKSKTSSCAGYRAAEALLNAPGKELDNLHTLAEATNDKDPSVAHVAGFLLDGSSRGGVVRAFKRIKDKPELLPPAVADRLLSGLAALRGDAAARAVRPAAWAASLKGRLDGFSAVIEKHANPNVAALGIAELMQYGRLKGFAAVQRYARSGRPAWVRAALEAPRRGLFMWTDEERDAICPWAKGYLGSADLQLATSAAYMMLHCKRDRRYLEALLAEGRRRVAAGQWKKPFDLPFSVFVTGILGGPTPEDLLDEDYAFLESVTNNPKVSNKMRARALKWIVEQRRDQKSYDLLKKYRRHKVKELAKVAAEGMAMLERFYVKKR